MKLPPKPKRLAWQEQKTWRDGASGQLSVDGPAGAWYVARKVKSETARTMTLEFAGGAAAKVWLNGNVVGEYEAEPELSPEAAAAKAKLAAQKKKDAAKDEDDFFAMRMGREEREPRRLRLGLRAGDNYVVIKLCGKGAGKPAAAPRELPPGAEFFAAMAMGGDDNDGENDKLAAMMGRRGGGSGLSFSCRFRPEGDDRLDYATMQALRVLAGEREAVAQTAQAAPSSNQIVPATLRRSAATDADDYKPKTPAERRNAAVRRWYRTRIDIAGRVLFDELVRLRDEKRRVEAKLPSALVMEELKTPRQTQLFIRGDYRKKGEPVSAHTPAVLPPMAADLPKNRLGLARWLVSPNHPLTARVTVNRAWQQFFGLGLVRTADDFGIRGMPPSHPQLLDWLATEFVRTGWDLKQLHRLLVLSATYRQSSTMAPELLAKDPDNVLLARGPRQRLSAEMLRDQALFASGLLVQKLGGPSVKPFQPVGLWQSMLGSGAWQNDQGDATHRRGLYTYWKRGVPYPSFTIYDASKRETCAVTRTRTTTPLQALVTLNDPVYVEAGRALGLRMHHEGGKDDDARLAFGFRLVTSRAPDADELAILRSLLADQRKHYADKADLAKALFGIKEPKGKGGKGGAAKEPGEGKQPQPKADQKAEPKDDDKAAGETSTAEGKEPAAAPAKKVAATEPAAADGDSKPQPSKQPAKDEPAASTPATAEAVGTPPLAPKPATAPNTKLDPKQSPAEAAAWAQIGCTLLNLEAAIRRG